MDDNIFVNLPFYEERVKTKKIRTIAFLRLSRLMGVKLDISVDIENLLQNRRFFKSKFSNSQYDKLLRNTETFLEYFTLIIYLTQI